MNSIPGYASRAAEYDAMLPPECHHEAPRKVLMQEYTVKIEFPVLVPKCAGAPMQEKDIALLVAREAFRWMTRGDERLDRAAIEDERDNAFDIGFDKDDPVEVDFGHHEITVEKTEYPFGQRAQYREAHHNNDCHAND